MDCNDPMKLVVWILLILLIILHQDVWYWDDAELIFGFCPKGLAYHIAISLAASVVWLLATKFAWPTTLVSLDSDVDSPQSSVTAQDGGAKI